MEKKCSGRKKAQQTRDRSHHVEEPRSIKREDEGLFDLHNAQNTTNGGLPPKFSVNLTVHGGRYNSSSILDQLTHLSVKRPSGKRGHKIHHNYSRTGCDLTFGEAKGCRRQAVVT